MNQKRTKGFTLIELLAVIVILAIIALIAVPVILNIIDKTNKSAFKDTAYGIVNAAELYFAEQQLEPNGMLEDKTFDLSTSTELQLKGNVPNGNVLITKEGKTALAVQNGRYCITKGVDDEDITVIENYTTCELPKEKATLPIEWYAGSDVSNLTKLLDENGEVIAYKISDYAVSMDELKDKKIELDYSGTIIELPLFSSTEDSILFTINENAFGISDMFFVALAPDADLGVAIASETGVYMTALLVNEGISFSIGGKLKLETKVEITETSISWNGIETDLECVESTSGVYGKYCKVSNDIPSMDVSNYTGVTVKNSTGAETTQSVFVVLDDGAYIAGFFEAVIIVLDDSITIKETNLTTGVWFLKQTDDEDVVAYPSLLTFNKDN